MVLLAVLLNEKCAPDKGEKSAVELFMVKQEVEEQDGGAVEELCAVTMNRKKPVLLLGELTLPTPDSHILLDI